VVLTFVANQTLTRQALLDSEYDKMSVLAYEVVRQIEEVMTTAAGSLAALASKSATGRQPGRGGRRVAGSSDHAGFPRCVFRDGAVRHRRCAAGRDGLWADCRIADAAGFRRALAGQAAFSIPHLVLGRPELYITAFCPVRDGRGQIRHVVGARLPMEKIAQILRAVRIGQQGFLVLLDDRGNVLAHPDAGRTLEKFDEQTPMYFWKHHSRGIYPPGQAEPFAFVSAVIGPEQTRTGQPWVLLALKPYAEVLALPREEMRLHLAVALLTIAVVTLVGLVLSRRLSRPIMNLAAAAQRVAHGNLDANVPENGPREIHQLGVAFNQMVRELRQHHERLESVVQQRTLKLRDSQRRQEQLTAHLRAAYESIVDGILILEWPSGKVIAANQHFADLFGLAPAELQGRNAAEVSAAIREHFVEPRDNALRWDHYQRLSEEVGLRNGS
jgi:HAMP domain-containing protein